jgi:hypothetical protein
MGLDGLARAQSTSVSGTDVLSKDTKRAGLTVYYRFSFDDGLEAWTAANEARLVLSDDGVDGRALRVVCEGSWAGARVPLDIRGSAGLKMALLMKGRNITEAGVNIHDMVSGDNTTPYGYRYLRPGEWRPILYFLDRCRYNSRTTGFVSADTKYDELRFYGPFEFKTPMEFSLDNLVLYRGADSQPPGRVTGLEATATAGGIKLSWDRAADNVGPLVYVISRADGDGFFRKVAESCVTSYMDRAAGRGKRRYRVLAVDFEENLGAWSDPVSVISASEAYSPELTREEKEKLIYAEHVRQIHAKGRGRVHRGRATLFGDSLTGATVYPHCARAAFGNLMVDAFGYPSMKTSFGRDKVGEILRKENPEFMFILFGTNNSKREQDIQAAMDDLAAIVKTCEANGTIAVVGTIPPRDWSPDSAPEANFNKNIVELCRRLKTPVGYIFEDFQAAGDRSKYMGSDGVHWRGAGMEIAARAWGKTLEQIRFVLRDRDRKP